MSSFDEAFKKHETAGVEVEVEQVSTNASINTAIDEPNASLKGWRLRLLTLGLALAVFLASLDSIIVSTALTAIAKDLQSWDKSSWVVSSYLTTYFSFLVIWAKVSDLVGRKLMLITALVLFLAFSGGCGGARTMLQLIVLRALQGIGGAGLFSLVPIITAEMVHPDKYASYNAVMALSIALSFLLGPLIGGGIVDHTTWRWIFYINLPAGAVSIVLVWFSMPGAFPDISHPTSLWSVSKNMNLRGRVDYLGFSLLLAASLFLIVAIEEAAILYTWDNAVVITLLALALPVFCAFLCWVWFLDRSDSTREPVFPWRFAKNRVLMGLCLICLLSGVPLTTLVLDLPGRFQILNNTSALDSGIRILPLTLTIAVSSALAGGVTARGRVPPIFVFSISAVLQTVGLGLLYSVPADRPLEAKIYGYQTLIGTGVGMCLATAILTVPSLVEGKDLSAAIGSVTQIRVLGGAVGVSVATNLLNNSVQDHLLGQVAPEVLRDIMKNVSSIAALPQSTQLLITEAFADGYERQLLLVLGFCAAEVLALGLMWERPMRRLV
ncbi:putative MFS multidrug transporter [Aspergillus mulundensis]|uniref:Major facilitator superfamily (MFS) profile domain-containing protein n=1 Tax=Aspergillus mulundensis TaxID=1810919 RepID=A0A3D8T5H6_9EURO|nr:hypothetical protein DSM5745_01125 [Aspergillus mulundensis]RDW93803.1 hypothetical protein DSM5745_01125 [Aspergillus mulundensis]